MCSAACTILLTVLHTVLHTAAMKRFLLLLQMFIVAFADQELTLVQAESHTKRVHHLVTTQDGSESLFRTLEGEELLEALAAHTEKVQRAIERAIELHSRI